MPRGGRRPGAGRPLGRADAIPRPARQPRHTKRIKRAQEAAQAHSKAAAQAYGETSPTPHSSDEFLITSEDRTFAGSALELIRSIYRAEGLPVKVRLYAAKEAAAYETRVGEDGQLAGIQTEVHVYLPDNGRDPELEERLGGITMEERREHEHRRRQNVERKDEQLREWIRAGFMTEEGAVLARSQWIIPGDCAWTPQCQMIEYHPQPLQDEPTAPVSSASDGEIAAPAGALEPSATEPPQTIDTSGRVILLAWPGQVINLRDGRPQYRANERGEIAADPDDVDLLLVLGCRRGR